MTESPLVQRQRTALNDLFRLVADTTGARTQTESEHSERDEAAKEEFQQKRQQIISDYQTDKADAESEFETTQQRINARYRSDRQEVETDFTRGRDRVS